MFADGSLTNGPGTRHHNGRQPGKVRIFIAIALGALTIAGCADAPAPSVRPQPSGVPIKLRHKEAHQDAALCRAATSIADFARTAGIKSDNMIVLANKFASIYENKTGFRDMVVADCINGLRGKPPR